MKELTNKQRKEDLRASPTCPECKEELESLDWDRYPHQEGTVSLNKEGEPEIDEEFNIYDMQDTPYIYSCPNCGKELTRDDEEAESILKGEEVSE